MGTWGGAIGRQMGLDVAGATRRAGLWCVGAHGVRRVWGGRGSNGNRGEGGKGRAQGLGTQVRGLCPRGLQSEGQPTTLLVASGIRRWPRRQNCPHASVPQL